MNRVEPCAENFVDPLQVVQISAGEIAARVAITVLVERPRIEAVSSVTDLDVAVARE